MSRHLEILLGELTEPFRAGFHMDGREGELEEALEGLEQAETLVHRIATMMRTIADLKIRLDRVNPRIRKLEDALRRIKAHVPGNQEIQTAYGKMVDDALEEEIPF